MEQESKLIDLYIPDNTPVVKAGEYFGREDIRSVHIGPNIQRVGQGAFASCPNLQKIVYCPNTVFEDCCFNNDKKISSITCGDATFKTICTGEAYYLGILHECTRGISLYKGGFCKTDELCQGDKMNPAMLIYLASIKRNGVEYTWFSESPELAIVSTRYKASGKSFNEFFKVQLTPETPLVWSQFQLIMGICHFGRRLWDYLAEKNGFDPNGAVLLKDIKRVLENNSNMLYHRFKMAIDKQNQVFNWLDYDKLYPSELFIKEYSKIRSSLRE